MVLAFSSGAHTRIELRIYYIHNVFSTSTYLIQKPTSIHTTKLHSLLTNDPTEERESSSRVEYSAEEKNPISALVGRPYVVVKVESTDLCHCPPYGDGSLASYVRYPYLTHR